MSSMRTLKAGEMFAGYGGLALAVSSVFGAKTAWLCEVDKYALLRCLSTGSWTYRTLGT